MFDSSEVKTTTEKNKILVILPTILTLTIPVILICQPKDFLRNFLHYATGVLVCSALIFLYTTLHFVYAYTNFHDVSWGTRPEIRKEQTSLIIGDEALNLEKNTV